MEIDWSSSFAGLKNEMVDAPIRIALVVRAPWRPSLSIAPFAETHSEVRGLPDVHYVTRDGHGIHGR